MSLFSILVKDRAILPWVPRILVVQVTKIDKQILCDSRLWLKNK
jgi:hypothetical protein